MIAASGGRAAVQSIESVLDPRVEDYRNVRDRDLLRRRSLFMVEGRGNLRRLIAESAYSPRSVFLSRPAHEALQDTLEALPLETPVFVASREVLSEIAGFDIHRGCLAACDRGPDRGAADLMDEAIRPAPASSLVVVLEGLTDPDNVGAVFRNAMAFGADAVLLCPRCCDPLYRKAIRVSMGAALCVPTARCQVWPDDLEVLRATGHRIVALDPNPGARDLVPDAAGAEGGRVALLLGGEGPGLSQAALAVASERVRIPMAPGFDSLNVATAAAVALHHFHAARARLG